MMPRLRRLMTALAVPVLVASAGLAQSAPPTFYAESFRKGPTHITEDKFDVKLTPEAPVFKQRLKDAGGAERYELVITPKISAGEGNDKITSWELSLRDLRHVIYGNLLQFDQEFSEAPRDNLFWLNPQRNAAVPIRVRRIFKIDSFFIAFQAKDFHFTPPDSPYLDSMSLTVQLSNADPRDETQ